MPEYHEFDHAILKAAASLRSVREDGHLNISLPVLHVDPGHDRVVVSSCRLGHVRSPRVRSITAVDVNHNRMPCRCG